MNEQSAVFDAQPLSEPFQLCPIVETINQEIGGTPEAIKKYFGSLSFDDFSILLNGLNAYFRGILGQHTMDGYGLMADGYMPPNPEDRIPLLKEAFKKAMENVSQEKCAVVLGMSILSIHPYLDANGRTSRTIFALLTNGYSGSNKDKALFSEIGQKDEDEEGHHRSGFHVVDLDPSNVEVGDHLLSDLISGEMKELAIESRFGANHPNLPTRVGFSNSDSKYCPISKLSKEEQRELGNIFRSDALAFVACVNSFSDDLYRKSLRHINFEDKEYDVIAYRNIIKDITKNDLLSLRKAFRQVRIDYVRRLMGVADRDDFQIISQQYLNKLDEWKA